jgi:hypothetical protein
MKIKWLPLEFAGVFLFWFAPCIGAQDARWGKEIQSPAIRGAKVFRDQDKVGIVPESVGEAGSVHIPRFCASVRSVQWLHEDGDVTLTPEVHHWVVSWKKSPAKSKAIRIQFDQPAVLPEELKPSLPLADGSIMLNAFQAATLGDKLRFEPQPHKNTVGYWVVPEDRASWTLQVDSAGTYSVGLLQGCGQGQGGSQARIELASGEKVVATTEFTVLETGHFQNFRWLHAGHVDLQAPGMYQLSLSPVKIAKAALMDVRSIQLVKQAKKMD